jgi:hypothetical protein
MLENTFVIPVKTPNPCLQTSAFPGTGLYVPAQMDSRFHGNDEKIVLFLTLTKIVNRL